MSFTTLIDAAALRGLLAGTGDAASDSRLALLDCRFDLSAPHAGRQAYVTAHLPGARYVDLDLDLAAPIDAGSGRHPLPHPEALARRFASYGIRPDTQVVAYDDASGAFAARAWWLLRWLGHFDVAVLDGGFKAWVASGGSLECGTPVCGITPDREEDAARITRTANADWVMNSADVLTALRDPARLLVDARAPERFAGTVEPIDSVAGHVKGAVNHPFTSNLGADGRFLTPAELRQRWQARLGDTAPQDAILMCGSGVTACHNLLAMELARLPGAKLYAGSWSEWIRDPRRPVVCGSEP